MRPAISSFRRGRGWTSSPSGQAWILSELLLIRMQSNSVVASSIGKEFPSEILGPMNPPMRAGVYFLQRSSSHSEQRPMKQTPLARAIKPAFISGPVGCRTWRRRYNSDRESHRTVSEYVKRMYPW